MVQLKEGEKAFDYEAEELFQFQMVQLKDFNGGLERSAILNFNSKWFN